MNGNLLLENGSLFDVKVTSNIKNVLGNLFLNSDNTIALKCNLTGKIISIVECINNNRGDIVLKDIDFTILKTMIINDDITGKIVIDSLPLDFHFYDLESNVTLK
mgnify:CR=1 FL=1